MATNEHRSPAVTVETERDDDSASMVRITVRITKEAREDLDRFARAAMMKPTYYASLCMTLGHATLKRILSPELMVAQMGLTQSQAERGSELTEAEKAQVGLLVEAGRDRR